MPNELKKLFRQIHQPVEGTIVCNRKHAKGFMRCQVGIVYNIPPMCGKVYVGQSGSLAIIASGNSVHH